MEAFFLFLYNIQALLQNAHLVQPKGQQDAPSSKLPLATGEEPKDFIRISVSVLKHPSKGGFYITQTTISCNLEKGFDSKQRYRSEGSGGLLGFGTLAEAWVVSGLGEGQIDELLEGFGAVGLHVGGHVGARVGADGGQPLALRVGELGAIVRGGARGGVDMRAHELLVQDDPPAELRQHEPRGHGQLDGRVERDPREHRRRRHLQQRHERVEHPVRQPLLVVLLERALDRHHRRIQRVQQHHDRPRQRIRPRHQPPKPPHGAAQLSNPPTLQGTLQLQLKLNRSSETQTPAPEKG
jgi:hypothetical protein